MRKPRGEMHRRMLGNGHCARPAEADGHFVTTIEFRPTLQAQRVDALNNGQVTRRKNVDGLLERLDHDVS